MRRTRRGSPGWTRRGPLDGPCSAGDQPRKPAERLRKIDSGPSRRYPAGATAAMSVLNSKVLVLNRSYLPVHITSVRRALSLLYQDVAQAVDHEYRTFDFASWAALAPNGEKIGLVNAAIRVPRVILLRAYDRMPRRHVRFSRYN